MQSRLTHVALLLLVAAGALAFRLPRLGERPMHADEAVQAAIFRRLWLEGRYVYNPHEFHGPTLPYATLASPRLPPSGDFADTTKATFRVVPALFGAALVLLLLLLADALGKPAALCAGVLTAISPAMVFYSRYFIHETLLVFFTLAAIATGWRYVRTGRLAWCVAAGACVGLMQATKETCVIAYAAMATGLVLLWACRRATERRSAPDASGQALSPTGWKCPVLRPASSPWHLAAGLAAAIVVAVVLFSSFFANPRGPIDALLTYLPWLTRAGGETPHLHPWYDYLHRLAWYRIGDGPVWSEGLILGLAAVGFAAAWLPKRGEGGGGNGRPRGRLAGASVPFVRWLGLYTLALTAAYGLLPYKTPWCLLGFLHAMILLAGVGAVALVRFVTTRPLKVLVAVVLLAAAGQLGWQSYRASYVLADDPRSPYVYAATLPDAARLADTLEEIAAASPAGRRVPIDVVWHDAYYWPLPWSLRRFERVGYWAEIPEGDCGPIVVSSAPLDEALTAKLDATHLMTGFYGLRPNVLAQLWVRLDLWEAHLRRQGAFDDPPPQGP